jgi:hypothetical protein
MVTAATFTILRIERAGIAATVTLFLTTSNRSARPPRLRGATEQRDSRDQLNAAMRHIVNRKRIPTAVRISLGLPPATYPSPELGALEIAGRLHNILAHEQNTAFCSPLVF